MSIDTETVDKLARLSRLEFSGDEKEQMQTELGKILEFISQLQEVDTTNVMPMASTVTAESTREREDEVTATNRRDALLEVAPAQEMGFFLVPRVIE